MGVTKENNPYIISKPILHTNSDYKFQLKSPNDSGLTWHSWKNEQSNHDHDQSSFLLLGKFSSWGPTGACERLCFGFKSYLQWHSHTDQLKWLRNEFRLPWIRSNPCLPLVGKLQFVFVHFSSFFFFFFFFVLMGTFNITYQTCYIVLILRTEGQFSRHFADYYSTLTYANFSRRFSHCWLWLARK